MTPTYRPELAELRARRIIAQGLAPSKARPDWREAESNGTSGSTQGLSPAWAVVRSMIALQGQKYVSGIDGIVPFTIAERPHREYIMPASQSAVTQQELDEALSRKYVLPAFDEYLMGYGSRDEILDESRRNQILTKNGIGWPFIVENGVITDRR